MVLPKRPKPCTHWYGNQQGESQVSPSKIQRAEIRDWRNDTLSLDHLHRHLTTLQSPYFNPRVFLRIGSPGDPPMRILRRQLRCCEWITLISCVFRCVFSMRLRWRHRWCDWSSWYLIATLIDTGMTRSLVQSRTLTRRHHWITQEKFTDDYFRTTRMLWVILPISSLCDLHARVPIKSDFARLECKPLLASCYQNLSWVSISWFVSRNFSSRTQISSSQECIGIHARASMDINCPHSRNSYHERRSLDWLLSTYQ